MNELAQAGALPRRGWHPFWLIATALVVGWFYVWTARSTGEPWKYGAEQRDYYNFLIDGWLDGQLHMKVDVPPALLALKDPYDPRIRPIGLGLHDASFYRGKYYVYFGVAPVVTLMLPYRVLTGTDLPLAVTVLVFTYGGFLASALLWWAIGRRYFPGSQWYIGVLGVLVLGFAGLGPMLIRRPHMWEGPIAGGYCFAMLTLACVWRSLHAERRGLWFGLAALALGLAIASRPTYLLASPLLALPLLFWWQEDRRVPWRAAVCAVVPLAVVGSLMALHNFLRFGNPLEFGQAYQFSLDYESKVTHFSRSYVPFNGWRYFFSVAQWSDHFPFIQPAHLPPKPAGFGGHDDVYGVMTNLPFAWLALLAPLAVWRRDTAEWRRLATWLGSATVLFAVMAGVLLCFFGSLARYQIDFTPTLMLLACVGLLAGERLAQGWRPTLPRVAIGIAAGVLALVSVAFGVLFSLQLDNLFVEKNRQGAQEVARVLNTIPATVQRLLGVKHGGAEMTVQFRPEPGKTQVLLSVGDEPRVDRLLVHYVDAERTQFAIVQDDAPEIRSRPLRINVAEPQSVRVVLGSLFPSSPHPLFAGRSREDVSALSRQVYVEVAGHAVINERRVFQPGTARVAAGRDAVAGKYDPFRGEVSAVHRFDAGAISALPSAFVRLRLTFPNQPTRPIEPLIIANEMTLFVQYYDDAGRMAFGMAKQGERMLSVDVVNTDPSRAHELIARWMPVADPGRRRVEVVLDGTVVCSRELEWSSSPMSMMVGKTIAPDGRMATEFSGRMHDIQSSAEGRDPLASGGDRLRLLVQLPRSRMGVREPLVVAGRRGQGDLISIHYVNEKTVRFGADHWGTGLVQGPEVSIDYAKLNELELTVPSLAARPDRHTLRGPLQIRLNGAIVWEQDIDFYAIAPDEFALGRDPIGGSSCEPWFTGDIIKAERLPRE